MEASLGCMRPARRLRKKPYTSQRCSACGHVDAGNRVSQAEFQCLSCGHEANADLNAAINILALAAGEEAASSTDSLNACGEDVRPDQPPSGGLVGQTSMKQEPGTRACLGSDRGPSWQRAAAVPGFT